MHIVGAIVGEHTYNVDAYDRLQTYYVKAVSYLKSSFSFSYDGEDIADFVHAAAILRLREAGRTATICGPAARSVWNRSFRGRNVGGTDFPDDRFSATFFQPSMPARHSGSASSIR